MDNYVLILRKHIVSRVSSYFPEGGHSVTRNVIKICKRIKVQALQNIIQKDPQQKYHLGTISNIKVLDVAKIDFTGP